MTAKEELRAYKYKQDKVQYCLEEYRKYKDRATQMISILSDMPRNPSPSNKNETYIVEMADISREYEKAWLEAEKEKIQIENRINSIGGLYATILRKRYIEGLTLEQISTEENYSYIHIRRMHGEALEYYRKKYIKDDTK